MAEIPSNPQASEFGMASTLGRGFEVITTGVTGAGVDAVGWRNSGCVFVMLTVGATLDAGLGRTLMRAVSFFGPRFTEAADIPLSSRTGGTGRRASPGAAFASGPGGFGNGCRSGDEAAGDAGGVTGGRRGKILGASVADSGAAGGGVTVGGRRIGVVGVREGRTMRAVSRFSRLGAEPAWAGRGGSAMRTVSFFGSAMRASRKIAQIAGRCHLLFTQL